MIELDGSQGEGGGQILRSALSMSLLTGEPFRLQRIRARRPKPGLAAQHLTCVLAAQAIGGASVDGAKLGSTELTFTPGQVTPGKYHFAVGTAGATALVLQTIYLPLARCAAPSVVTIAGGTHVKAAPCFEFLERTWAGYLRHLGFDLGLKMQRRGFYPRGGGSIQADIAPCLHPRTLRAEPTPPQRAVCAGSIALGLPKGIAERQADRLAARLKKLKLEGDCDVEAGPGGPGTIVWVEFPTAPAPTVFFSLGERGKSAERVADDIADQIARYIRSGVWPVDAHSGDQLLLPLLLAAGPSEFTVAEVTNHLQTNAAVLGRFSERRIAIEGDVGNTGIVRIF